MGRELTAFRWNPIRIVVLHGLAVLLAVSIFWPPSAVVWRELSSAAFYSLNGSLAWGQSWAVIWAALNTRAFDAIGALGMLIPLIWYLYDARHVERTERLSRASLVIVAVAAMVGISKILLPGMRYPSPSLILEPFYSLRGLVPGLDAKITSTQSFPGDHAVFVFTYLAVGFAAIGRKYAFLGLLLGTLYVVPRLVSGAHWLSDNLVGGGVAALVAYGWAVHSPALHQLQTLWMGLSKRAPVRSLFTVTRLPA